MNKWWKLVIALIIPQVAGFLGSFFTTPKIGTWYKELIRPELNPPNWLFAPVWTTLFILMGIALWLIWSFDAGQDKTKQKAKRKAAVAFFVQLVLNVLWSVFFFGEQSPLLGLVVIVALWIMILITIARFLPVSRTAAWLLVPYILWVSFAAYLNYSIWKLN